MRRMAIWGLVLVAMLMGAFMAVQPAINGQLRLQVGTAAQAAMISTFVSTVSLAFFVFVVLRPDWPPLRELLHNPWWIWTGGLLGAVYVAMSVVLVQRLGGGVAFSLVILGQMVTVLVLEQFGLIGVPVHPINAPRVIGVLMVVGGAAMIRLF